MKDLKRSAKILASTLLIAALLSCVSCAGCNANSEGGSLSGGDSNASVSGDSYAFSDS